MIYCCFIIITFSLIFVYDKVCLSLSGDSSIDFSYSIFIQDDHVSNNTDIVYNTVTYEVGDVNSNYRISAVSHCINTGSGSVENLTLRAIDGVVCIVGSNIDIGAFEHQGTVRSL